LLLAREAPWYMMRFAGQAQYRRPRLNSNVRPQRKTTVTRRLAEDSARESRIRDEVVVDAYNETERAMSWYYYLETKLQMPFAASCRVKRSMSPLKVHDQVQVQGMAPEDDCMSEVFVFVARGGYNLAVPLSQLDCQSPDDDTRQAVADWHYWVGRGYEY
jgi:hypothetical protein